MRPAADRRRARRRELEPPGTDVGHLAVASNTFGFGERLYWTVGTTPKFLDL